MVEANPQPDLTRTRLLGWGLRCDEIVGPGVDIGRDLSLAPGANGLLDLALVRGVDALVQDLSVALTTALGSDIFNVSFGFDGINAIVEGIDATLTRERIRVSMIRTVAADPRVRRVLDVRLDDDGPLGNTPASRVMGMRVAFEMRSGDVGTLQLGTAPIGQTEGANG